MLMTRAHFQGQQTAYPCHQVMIPCAKELMRGGDQLSPRPRFDGQLEECKEYEKQYCLRKEAAACYRFAPGHLHARHGFAPVRP